MSLHWKPWSEIAPGITTPQAALGPVRQPAYGRYLEDFRPGETWLHPRGITLHAAFAQEFATTFMESCPLFLNEEYPRALGFDGLPVSPLMVLATTLSLGVQNESEKAIAHLGYYDVCFPRVTYAGDTLRAMTRILDKKERGPGEPGIVHVRTLGLNQRGEVAVRYERKIMIPPRPASGGAQRASVSDSPPPEFPWPDAVEIRLPAKATQRLPGWTAGATFFEDFTPGEIIIHSNGRTISDEHLPWTYRLGNTHPLHFDSVYSHAQAAPMGGAPVVYGGLAFSWFAGLASRDISENMVWDLGYTQGYHTQPVRTGDTLFSVSRVLQKEDGPVSGAGIVTLQLVGLRNCTGSEALSKHGMALFVKENDKKKLGLDKIPAKAFEIERRLLIRRKKS